MKTIKFRREPDKILEKTLFWIPPVSDWKPIKKKKSNLRIAAIVSDHIYHGIRYEGDILVLTPENWKNTLLYGIPDFILIESTWNTCTRDWYMAQSIPTHERDILLQLLDLAKKQNIPTVFWNTKDHVYHAHYKDISTYFDFVFCSDPNEMDALNCVGVNAEILLPCVQPALYNPFRYYEEYDSFSLNILFDGWADIDRFTNEYNMLKDITQFNLSIIESRYHIFRQRIEQLPDYKDHILGCVNRKNRIQALKYSKVYITFDQTLSSKITQQWMALEAAACRLPIVHYGTISDCDIRKDFIIEYTDINEFLVELKRFKEDDLYRERIAQLSWRSVHKNHTFAHRIGQICQRLGINHGWNEYPKVTLNIPTYREHLLQKCLETYDRQNYPNKELIIVFNCDNISSVDKIDVVKNRKDIRIANIPSELFAAACLNYGNLMADGEYCFRIDDDDHYGSNYISDMILHAKCIDVNLFGKPPSHLLLEENQRIYSRNKTPQLCIVPLSLLTDGNIWPGGNSISGRTRYFKRVHYPDLAFCAADTSFLFNLESDKNEYFAMMDNFNLVAERRSDQRTHTWKINSEKIKKLENSQNTMRDLMI